MSDEDWQRPLHPGFGDERALAPDRALAFLVAFGVDPDAIELHERHKVRVLDGVLDYAVGDHDTIDAFLAPPAGDLLREVDADLVDACLATEHCLIVRGDLEDPPDLEYLRSAIGLATAAVDAGAIAVYSLQNFALFPATEWVADVFAPDVPPVRQLVRVLWSDEQTGSTTLAPEGTAWVHTRGMRAFGRPDLSVRGVPAHQLQLAGGFCNAVATQLARGLLIEDGAAMDIGDGLGPVAFFRRGHLDDPEFNNTHYEVDWPSADSAT